MKTDKSCALMVMLSFVSLTGAMIIISLIYEMGIELALLAYLIPLTIVTYLLYSKEVFLS